MGRVISSLTASAERHQRDRSPTGPANGRSRGLADWVPGPARWPSSWPCIASYAQGMALMWKPGAATITTAASPRFCPDLEGGLIIRARLAATDPECLRHPIRS